ncbi:MAG: VWA domain-containing protein [Bacillota bacterium]
MGINFTEPWKLVFLLLGIYIVFLWMRSPKAFAPWQQKLFLALRLLLVLCLVLALAGFGLGIRHKQKSVVFVADLSASVADQKQAEADWIGKSMAALAPDTTAGVVSLGKKPMVEYPIGPATEYNDLQAVIDPNYTDLAAGLRLARSLLPDNRGKQIVLLSDGKQNREDALDLAKSLQRQGVRLDVLPLVSNPGPEALVKELKLPNRMLPGETFNLEAGLESTTATSGTLRLTVDNRILRQEQVQIAKGETRVVWGAQAEGPGMHTYKLELTADDDTRTENNLGVAVAQVAGPPKVLVAEGTEEDGRAIIEALRAVNVDADVALPPAVPKTLSGLTKYSAVILANVPASSLSGQTLDSLETYVKDLGRGLVMVGGEDSFGPGGYYKTPVEKALPVYMDIKKKGEIPSIGINMVIDKSGSMCHTINGVSKMDMAKEAAIRALDALEAKDRLGIVIFDTEYKWVVKTAPLKDKQDVQDKIGSIQPGGGTNMFPALEASYESLKDADVKVKHIILLSDGVSKYGGDYGGLLKKMDEANITLTTVAVGSDSDTGLLSNLARLGRGRYYYTDDISSIPSIFAKETFLATRTYMVQEPFTPAITGSSSMLPANHALPQLYGYVATTAKDSAEVILSSYRDDLVLARWQYGLGRTVAWTSDAKGRWAGDWVNWDSFPQFWGKVISWVLPQAADTGMVVSTSNQSGEGKINIEFPTERAQVHDILAKVVTPDGSTQELNIPTTGPGRNQAAFPMDRQGSYLIQVVQTSGDQTVRQATVSMVQSYSPEYQLLPDQRQFMQALADAGGGQVLQASDPASVGDLPVAAVWGQIPLAANLLFLAALLLLLDIAVRRFNLHLRWVSPLWQKAWGLVGGRTVQTEHGPGRLAKAMQAQKAARESFYRGRTVESKNIQVQSNDHVASNSRVQSAAGGQSGMVPQPKGSAEGKTAKSTPDKENQAVENFTAKLLERKRRSGKGEDRD